jgi:hypothetical protein
MGRPENHATRQLNGTGSYLADEIRPIAKPIDRHRCSAFEIGKRSDKLALVKNGPVMEI